MIVSHDVAPYFKIHDGSTVDIQLTMVDRSTAIGLPKTNGLQQSITDCGEWNYIYSFDASTMDTGARGIPYSATENNLAMYIVWVDKFGRIISSLGTSQVESFS